METNLSTTLHQYTADLLRMADNQAETPQSNAFSNLRRYIDSVNAAETQSRQLLPLISRSCLKIIQTFSTLSEEAKADLRHIFQMAFSKTPNKCMWLSHELSWFQKNSTALPEMFFDELSTYTLLDNLPSELTGTLAQDTFKAGFLFYKTHKQVLSPNSSTFLLTSLYNILIAKIYHLPEIEEIILGFLEAGLYDATPCSIDEWIHRASVTLLTMYKMGFLGATESQLRLLYERCSKLFIQHTALFQTEQRNLLQESLHNICMRLLHITENLDKGELKLEDFLISENTWASSEDIIKRNLEVWNSYLNQMEESSLTKNNPVNATSKTELSTLLADLARVTTNLHFCSENSQTVSFLVLKLKKFAHQSNLSTTLSPKPKLKNVDNLINRFVATCDLATHGKFMEDELSSSSPKTVSINRLREIELSLLWDDLLSSTTQTIITTLSLELLINQLYQSLLEKEAYWEPHPTQSGVKTLRPLLSESEFHIRMEDALCMHCADSAYQMLALSQKETPETQCWLHFLILHSLEEFLAQKRKQCISLLGKFNNAFSKRLNPRHQVEIIDTYLSITSSISEIRQSTNQDSIYDNCSSNTNAQQCLREIHSRYLSLYHKFCTFALSINEKNAQRYLRYEHLSELFKKHASLQKGYSYIEHMPAKLSIADEVRWIDPTYFSEPFDTHFFPALHNGFIADGTRGVAFDFCSFFGSRGDKFLNVFLTEVDLAQERSYEQQNESPKIVEIKDGPSSLRVNSAARQQKAAQKSNHHSSSSTPTSKSSTCKPETSVLVPKKPVQQMKIKQEKKEFETPPIITTKETSQLPQCDKTPFENNPESKKPTTAPKIQTKATEPAFQKMTEIMSPVTWRLNDRVLNENVSIRLKELEQQQGFFSPQARLNFYLSHTYPTTITRIVRKSGLEKPWHKSQNRPDRSFLCLACFHIGDLTLFGFISETYTRKIEQDGWREELYHRYLHPRSRKEFMLAFETQKTLFKTDSETEMSPPHEAPTLYELQAYEKLCSGESLFEDTSTGTKMFVPEGRRTLEIQHKGSTVRIIDPALKSIYELLIG